MKEKLMLILGIPLLLELWAKCLYKTRCSIKPACGFGLIIQQNEEGFLLKMNEELALHIFGQILIKTVRDEAIDDW